MRVFRWFVLCSFYLVISCSTVPPQQVVPKNISLIKIFKSKRILEAYEKGVLLKTYKISLGKQPVGHKHFEGDNKTPEGKYFVDGKNDKSKYHKNLGVSYPNQTDRAYAKKFGKSAGGDIKIHGLPNGKGNLAKFYMKFDWTAGCIALSDEDIDELYAAVKIKTPIHIFK